MNILNFLGNSYFPIFKEAALDVLEAGKFVSDCRSLQRRGAGVNCDEFDLKMTAMNFSELHVDDDLNYFHRTRYPELYFDSMGELVVFVEEVIYYYESAADVNDIAYEKEFTDALAARKSYDLEFGWKSSHIVTLRRTYSRPAISSEIEKAIRGERLDLSPPILDPNTLSYDWTEEEIKANEKLENSFWDREIEKERAEIEAWGKSACR